MTNAIVDTNRSQCGIKTSKKEAILTVSWKSPFGGNNSLAQKFSVDGNYYYLSDYSVSLVINVNKDILNASATVEDKDTFRTPFGKSLICDRGTNITYKRTDSQITLRLYDVKLQAFDAGKDFSDDQYECPKKNSQVYLIVVILFGVTVLVALMLAIFVYRRNTEHTREGYGSMQ
ncbi:hypothetical protein BSL78_08304 [Apostichopus japonicus]|uniref:Lysosome-associated membrane glycoprotein 1 n=1 Tax=Stichopus japonicus TaxID=307972 RepID=A0A2G8L3G2_STIJA|nr:hypothetical protein BSL78_08304 [Apostichopus japonicus]